MPADNAIYETLDDWWDPTGSVAGLHAMNPARAAWFAQELERRLGPLGSLRLLDLGCGGGLLAEELARRGARVTGLDLAHGALRAALAHARGAAARPAYVRGAAERLPFGDATFDAVATSDVLEHVRDRAALLGEAARVIRAGGLFLYDTINRTWLTRLVHIGLLQRWRRLVPRDTHDWAQFVRPAELARELRAAGLEPLELRGLQPVRPLAFALHLLRHRLGRDRMPPFRIGAWTAGSYVGSAARR